MSTILTAEELAAIREREKRATAEEWWILPMEFPSGDTEYHVLIGDQEDRVCVCYAGECTPKENAEFIVAAKQDIPRLLASHAALEQQLAERDKVIAELERQGREND